MSHVTELHTQEKLWLYATIGACVAIGLIALAADAFVAQMGVNQARLKNGPLFTAERSPLSKGSTTAGDPGRKALHAALSKSAMK